MQTIPSTILVIFGITGDLSRRKLLPAVIKLSHAGRLPANFRLIGVSRRHVSLEEVLDGVAYEQPEDRVLLESMAEMRTMDLTDKTAFETFRHDLAELERTLDGPVQRLYYLSVPPEQSDGIVGLLGEVGLADVPDTKLLLEKPFGTDLASAQHMVQNLRRHFDEAQIYRIDHYLAKEMAQNIVVFRSANALFKRSWSKEFIDRIEIIAAEQIGIEGRAAFYEQTGALRDLVQSHLLQLAALVLMPVDGVNDFAAVPAQRLAALSALQPPQTDKVTRGQYATYRTEVSNDASMTETFVSLELTSADPLWEGVPIVLTTGKGLHDKQSEIRVHYKQQHADEANLLTLRIQPREGIELCIWTKRPGYERAVEQLPLKMEYQDHFNGLPEAYEQVLFDALRSDHLLFTSSDEVLESWRIIDPVQRQWQSRSDDLVIYQTGSEPAQVTGA